MLHYRDAIVRWLYHVLQWENAQHYLSQLTHLPVAYEISDLAIISAFAFLICIVAGLLPSFKAAHIDRAKALRYEQ